MAEQPLGPDYKPTPAEQVVLDGCRRSALFRGGGLGLSTVAVAYHLIKRANGGRKPISATQRFLLVAAGTASFGVGVLSYSSRCIEKLMALEGSPMGESLKNTIVQAQQKAASGQGNLKVSEIAQEVASSMQATRAPHEMGEMTDQRYNSHNSVSTAASGSWQDFPGEQSTMDHTTKDLVDSQWDRVNQSSSPYSRGGGQQTSTLASRNLDQNSSATAPNHGASESQAEPWHGEAGPWGTPSSESRKPVSFFAEDDAPPKRLTYAEIRERNRLARQAAAEK